MPLAEPFGSAEPRLKNTDIDDSFDSVYVLHFQRFKQ